MNTQPLVTAYTIYSINIQPLVWNSSQYLYIYNHNIFPLLSSSVERSKSTKSTGMKTDLVDQPTKSMGQLVDQPTKSVGRLTRKISRLTNSRVGSPNRQVVIL